MNSENKQGFQLKWPWNWVVCGLFILGTWWFLGIFSILIVALFLHFQKKRHPDAVPQGGYCLDRTRKRLARLVWSLLYLVIALGCGIVFFVQVQEDHSAWTIEDWGTLVVAGVIALGAALFCAYETYTDLRDALFPAKSRLANSIRSQLPSPDLAPDVTELFAMVDRDIQENGIWFDRVAIGNEWVFGDDVSSIARIRGVFPRDEIKVRHTEHRRQTSRIIELWIVDDRKQIQCTGLRNPSELEMAVNCLRLRCPDAYFSNYNKMSNFMDKTDEEWQAMDRDFRRRRDQRLAQEEERKRQNVGGVSDAMESQGTAHLAQEAVAKQLAGLKEQLLADQGPDPDIHMRLSLSERTGATHDYDSFTRRDVELAGEGLSSGKYTAVALFMGSRYIYLQAGNQMDGRVTVNVSRPDPDKLRVFETKCTDRQAREWLLQIYIDVFDEDFSQWKDVTKKLEKQIKDKKKE